MDSLGLDIFDLGLDTTPAPIRALNLQPHTNALFSSEPDDAELLPATLIPRSPLIPWPSNLPRELAMGGDSTEEILMRNGLTDEDYLRFSAMPAFRRALSDAAKEVREGGASFRVLCHGIALDFLPVLDEKLHDPTVALAQKLDAFKHVVKLAGLEPKEDKGSTGGAPQVNIQINL